MKELEEIRATVGVPMKFVHIIRNPFDNIATQFLRVHGARDTAPDQKVNGKFHSVILAFRIWFHNCTILYW